MHTTKNDLIPELLQRARTLLAANDITLWLEPRYQNGWAADSSDQVENLAPLIQQAYQQRQVIAGDWNGQRILIAPITQEQQIYGALVAVGTAFGKPETFIMETLAEKLAMVFTMQALQETREDLAVYHEISHLSTSDQEWETILPEMAERLTYLFDADACAIALWDENAQRPKRLAAWGIDQAVFLDERNRPADTPTLTETVVREMAPVFIDEVLPDQAYPTPLIQEYGAKTLVAIPLIARGKGIGAAILMRMHSAKPFDPAQILKATPSLNHMALAVDNQLLLRDTRRRLDQTNILLEIAQIAASTLELDDMLRKVLERTQEILQVKAGSVLLYDHEQHKLRFHSAGTMFGVTTSTAFETFPVDSTESVMAQVFLSGQSRYINDLQELSPGFQKLARENKVENILVAPLRVQDFPVGIFVVGGKPGGFRDSDSALLTAIASHVAAALRNSQLLQDTRQRLRETESLQRIATLTSATLDLDQMLAAVLSEAVHLFSAGGGLFLLPDSDQKILQVHAASAYGVGQKAGEQEWSLDDQENPAIKVFHTGDPVLANTVPDGFPFRNGLFVPLRTRQRITGVLCICNHQERYFTATHANVATAIGSQIATSMENLLLFDLERQRADRMAIINRISQELTATLDLRGLIRKVVNNIHDVLGYEEVYIYLLDDAEENFIFQGGAVSNPAHELELGFTLPVSTGIMGRAVRTRQSQLVVDAVKDADFANHPQFSDLRSGLIVLLRHGDSVYGVIEVASTRENSFNEIDLTALENLGAQVSIAIDNARLYHQAQRRLLEQGIVHQIGQDLTSILDYNELVNAVARHMTRALDTASCTVSVYNPAHDTIRVEAEYRLPNLENYTPVLQVGSSYQLSQRAVAQQAIRTRRLVAAYRNDEKTPAEFRTLMEQAGNYSLLSVPMTIGERVIGLVTWQERRRDRRYSADDERLAQTLVSQAAIAVENARLYDQAQRRAREQALLRQVAVALSGENTVGDLLERFLRETRGALEASNGLVSLLNEEDRLIIWADALTTRTVDQMALGHLDKSFKALWKSLTQGDSVYLAPELDLETPAQQELNTLINQTDIAVILAPISHRGRLIGIVEIEIDPPTSAFDTAAIQLLESLTNQAAIAIQNVRFFEHEQRRLSQLEHIQSSGRDISSQLIKQDLLEIVVREAANIFDINAVAVLMPDQHELNYIVQAAHGLSNQFIAERRSVLEAGEKSASEEPLSLKELQEKTSPHQIKTFQDEDIQNALIVPLVKGKRVYGRLELYSKGYFHRFSEEDVEIARLFAGQVAIALDNAELFNALEERAIELAEANRLKSNFLANISHELRTPMNSILGFSETLLSGLYGELNEKQVSRVERIFRNGKNLLALIDDLLDISKIDAGRMELTIETVHLRDEISVILQAFESQVDSRGLYLKLNMKNDVPPVRADSLRLRQIVNNLVGNAAKFTKEGGITITAEHKREVVLNPRPDDPPHQDVVWISISDTGIGITLEDQLVIFDEFRQADGSTTREYGGTGLGLAICKRLVEMMGGRIWVDSEEGKGSTFTFVLPAASQN